MKLNASVLLQSIWKKLVAESKLKPKKISSNLQALMHITPIFVCLFVCFLYVPVMPTQHLLFISYAQIVILPSYVHGCLLFITSVNTAYPLNLASIYKLGNLVRFVALNTLFSNFSIFHSQPFCTLILALFNNFLQFWSFLLLSSILIPHDKTLEYLQSSSILDISLENQPMSIVTKYIYISIYKSMEFNNVSDKLKI